MPSATNNSKGVLSKRPPPLLGIPLSIIMIYTLMVCLGARREHVPSTINATTDTKSPPQWWFAVHRMETHHPNPLPDTVPLGVFSEGRAMQHVRVLADEHPARQIGTPGAAAVAKYILRHGQHLQHVAAQHRPDLHVEAFMETSSGAFPTAFSGVKFTSVYFDVHNVVYVITPSAPSPNAKAVLINAHFDNSQGTPGASDCASCVGVVMELASVIVHNASYQLQAPLVLLLNGGEETLFQGAHAFMHSSRINPTTTLGAFINLESTGPGGFETLIQHKGAWTAEAYARAAPYPRGAMWSQDQLDLHVIPGSTDFVVFGEHLPGVDVAFMLDAAAYHTTQDKVDRIKPGWIQSMGVNTLAVAQEFARVLAAEAYQEVSGQHTGQETVGSTQVQGAVDTQMQGAVGNHMQGKQGMAQRPSAAQDKAVFMDYFGFFMFTINNDVVHLMRALPLVCALSLPGLLHILLGHNNNMKGSLLGAYMAMVACFIRSVLALLCAVVMGAGVMGVGRVLLLGTPMVWFGSHTLTCLTFLPAAFAGASLPYLYTPHPPFVSYMAGYTLLAAVVAYVACGLGLGGGLFFTVATLGACTMLLLDGRGGFGSRKSAVLVHVFNTGPLSLSVSACFFGIRHVLEKITFVGHAPGPWTPLAQDLGVGVLLSVTLYFHIALVLPFVLVNLRHYAPRLVAAALMLSLLTAFTISHTRSPYSSTYPKRVWIQHMSDVEYSTGNVSHTYVLGSWDNIPSSVVVPEGCVGECVLLEPTGREWLSLPFLRDHFLTEVYAAPPPHPALDIVAAIQHTTTSATKTNTSASRGGYTHRLEYALHMPGGNHASLVFVLPVDGSRIVRWSFTDTPVYTDGQHPGTVDYSIWLTGADSPRSVDFWVDIEHPPGTPSTTTQQGKHMQGKHMQGKHMQSNSKGSGGESNGMHSVGNITPSNNATPTPPHHHHPRVTGVHGGVLEVSISTLTVASTELTSITARMPDWASVVQYETFLTVLPL